MSQEQQQFESTPAPEAEYVAEATSFESLAPETQSLLEGLSSSEDTPRSEPETSEPAEAQAEGSSADAEQEAQSAEPAGEPEPGEQAGETEPESTSEVRASDLELFRDLVQSQEANRKLREESKVSEEARAAADRIAELQTLVKSGRPLDAVRQLLRSVEGVDPEDAEIDLLGLLTDESLGVESSGQSSDKISQLEAELRKTQEQLREFQTEQERKATEAQRAAQKRQQYEAAISEARKVLDSSEEYGAIKQGVELYHALNQHLHQKPEDVVVEAMQHLVKSGKTDVTFSDAAKFAAESIQPQISKLKTLLAPSGDKANQIADSNERSNESGPRTLTNVDATRVPDGRVQDDYIEDDEESKLRALSKLKWD